MGAVTASEMNRYKFRRHDLRRAFRHGRQFLAELSRSQVRARYAFVLRSVITLAALEVHSLGDGPRSRHVGGRSTHVQDNQVCSRSSRRRRDDQGTTRGTRAWTQQHKSFSFSVLQWQRGWGSQPSHVVSNTGLSGFPLPPDPPEPHESLGRRTYCARGAVYSRIWQ